MWAVPSDSWAHTRLQAERNKHSQWKYFNLRVKNSAKIENCLENHLKRIYNVELRNTAYKTWSKTTLGLLLCRKPKILLLYRAFAHICVSIWPLWSMKLGATFKRIWPRKINYGYQTGMKKKTRYATVMVSSSRPKWVNGHSARQCKTTASAWRRELRSQEEE